MKLDEFSKAEILEKLNIATDKHSKTKLQAFLLVKNGISPSDVGIQLNKHHSQIYRWIAEAKKNGLENLKIKTGRGCKPKLNEVELNELEQHISHPIPLEDGYTRGWQSKDVKNYIISKYEVNYASSTIRKLLNKLGFRKKVCRPKNKRRNEELTQEFLDEIKKNEICWEKII